MAVACVLAFKQGKHDEAVKLMYQLEHPEDVATVLRVKHKLHMRSTAVSLVHLAAYHGWLDVVQYRRLTLLFDGKDSVGRTPLHYAAVGGSLPVVQYLITEQHCDPATPGLKNTTTLHYACLGGHINIVKYIITEHNCDPMCESIDKRTPLHYACEGGHKNIVQYLITELGCDPIVSNINGILPLHIACSNGHLDISKYLITEQNCDPMCEDKDKWTPLQYACIGGHKNIVEYLINEIGCEPKVPTLNHNLPLHISCRNRHLDLTKYLITKQNCNPTCENEDKWTPLHDACQGGHKIIVQFLLTELGCDPTVLTVNGSLPLHIACRNGHLDLTKYLITEQNCDPMCEDKDKWTPLHYACQGGHKNIVQYLITELGCDPKVLTINGNLPLHIACRNGHLDLTKYLITEQNCDPICENEDKWTPLHYACLGGHKNIVRHLLIELGCDLKVPDIYGTLPLHIAFRNGHLDLIKYLITEQNCDPMCENKDKWTPLHYACIGGHKNIVQYLITELGCDLTARNSKGCLPLHIACRNGHLDLTKYLITERNCDSMCEDEEKWTPLHYACTGGHKRIVQYLLTELGCDLMARTSNGILPLHIACRNGHLDLTKYLITEQKCDPMCEDEEKWTPLHYACQGGHMSIVQYLIAELGCDPIVPTINDNLPLHMACFSGHLDLIKYLITKQNCNPMCENKNKMTPLHYACQGGHKNIVQYLITALGCDHAIVPNIDGTLPLHIACRHGHLDLAKYFITEVNCDLTCKDKYGNTPLQCAIEGGHMNIVQYLIEEFDCDHPVFDDMLTWLMSFGLDMSKKVSEYFSTYMNNTKRKSEMQIPRFMQMLVSVKKSSPIHLFNKVILSGNNAAGKTTLAKVIEERAMTYFNVLKFGNVQEGKTNTAGIVPHRVESWEVGKIMIYDLAGHAEYHTSHSAVMETVMQRSPATYINVLDLSKKDSEIKQQFLYWLTFIDNATCRISAKSCLIVVGSHADLLSKEILKEKVSLVTNLVHERVKRHEYMGFVCMDCRKIDSIGTREFISVLYKSQQAVAARAPSVSYYCHLLYEFLQRKQVTCSLQELAALLAEEESYLPSELSKLAKLLLVLSDKGMITFLQNQQHLDKSWIVVDTEGLLKHVLGKLFAPKGFQEHQHVASSTGVVHPSSLQKLFPTHNLDMLISFLENLELCHRVNLSGASTNLKSRTTHLSTDDKELDLFFPSLLDACRPSMLLCEKFTFGWCLTCQDQQYQCFSIRFLHVLLLRLASTFPLAHGSKGSSSADCKESCNVWMKGISWDNTEGIRTVVEVIDNQSVLIAMVCSDKSRRLEYSKHRSAVIKLVLDLKQQLCPHIDTSEYLINQPFLSKWPAGEISPSVDDLLPMKNVCSSVLLQKPYIVTCKNIRSKLTTEQILIFEPYLQLNFPFICDLMDSSKSDEPVSPDLLSGMKIDCSSHLQAQRWSYSSLREYLDKMSLFAGKNLLVSEHACKV